MVMTYSLPAVISPMLENRFRWHFLLMVGSHARNVRLGMANQTRVDDKPEMRWKVTRRSKVK